MRLLKFTRYSEWWEYKLVPLLSVGYATIRLIGNPIDIDVILKLFFLLSAIVVGAIYVSVINDITDIEEDAKVGKSNRMAGISVPSRVLITASCVILGIIYGYLIYPDILTLVFYTMAYIVFSFYSLPPVRLKKRGIFGVLCDASGAHLFPTLLITSGLIYHSNATVDISWYISIAVWSLSYGLRGILWHQFYDRINDIRSGTTTFASKVDPDKFMRYELVIFMIEIVAFSFIIFYIFNSCVLVAIILYATLVFIRKRMFGYTISLIITPKHLPHQLLMNDFYLVFFPLSLLITLAQNNNYGWVVFFIHILLFPKKLILVLKDISIFFKKIQS